MSKVKRIEKLEHFFGWVGGEVAGRKRLHKLIFLSQELGIDFDQDFIFHHYGVYSPSLSQDLKLAKQWDILDEIREERSNGVEYRYHLLNQDVPEGSDGEEEVVNQIRELAQQPAMVLEVLSTIVFLDKQGYSKQVIVKKLKELKGHLQHCFDDAFRLAKDIFQLEVEVVN